MYTCLGLKKYFSETNNAICIKKMFVWADQTYTGGDILTHEVKCYYCGCQSEKKLFLFS